MPDARLDFAVVEKPLGAWTRFWNIGAVRKTFSCWFLRDLGRLCALAEQPAAVSNVCRHGEGVLFRHRVGRIAQGGVLHHSIVTQRLCGWPRDRGAAYRFRQRDAHRSRLTRNAHVDVQSAAFHRAAAAGTHLVRAGRRQHHFRV